MSKTITASTLFILTLLFSITSVFSQPAHIDSLKSQLGSSPDSTRLNLFLQISKAYVGKNTDSITYYADKALTHYEEAAINENKKIAEMEVRFETAQKEADLEKDALQNKLQVQQLNEANFQLIAILFISIITVAFVITFYFLRSRKAIAEREAQELQVEALEKRLLKLQLKHEGIEQIINISQIIQNLQPSLTENEIEALQLSLEGLPNNEIAEKMFVSINAVKFHLRNIYKKLGVSGKKGTLNYVAKP